MELKPDASLMLEMWLEHLSETEEAVGRIFNIGSTHEIVPKSMEKYSIDMELTVGDPPSIPPHTHQLKSEMPQNKGERGKGKEQRAKKGIDDC